MRSRGQTAQRVRQPNRERVDAVRVGLDDHLKRDDLVARAENAGAVRPSHAELRAARRMVRVVPFDFLSVVDDPDAAHTGVRHRGHQGRHQGEEDGARPSQASNQRSSRSNHSSPVA